MTSDLVPGEVRLREEPVTINEGRETTSITVANTGDRPIQVGSHFHFFEANGALRFDRRRAYGKRLAIPAGTAVRFEPGIERTVDLVAIGGHQRAQGMNGLVNGSIEDDPTAALKTARNAGFADSIDTESDGRSATRDGNDA